LRGAAIIGIAVGVLAAVIAAAAIWWLWRRRKSTVVKKEEDDSQKCWQRMEMDTEGKAVH
jgi:preprotein translocase subunit SecF